MAKTLSEALFGDSEGIEERQSRALARELKRPELAPSENTLQPGPLSFGDIFSTAVRGGTAQLGADINRFQAVGQMLTGFDEAAEKNLAVAESYDEISSDLLNQLQPFEEFLNEPTVGGFFTQVTKALGQFTPMMVSSFGSGLAGAGVGLLARAGVRGLSRNRKALNKLIEDVIDKRNKGKALSPDEKVILDESYGYAKWAKAGGITGAFGQEYVVGTSQAASEFQEAGIELTDTEAAQASLLGFPQAVLGTASETLFMSAVLKASLKKTPLVALERKAQTYGVQSLNKNEKVMYNIFRRKVNKEKLTPEENALLLKYSGPEKNPYYSFISDIGKGFVQSGAIEGITELGQEGLGVAQRFAIDPTYTTEESKLRLAEAAFAGFFAGGARGGAGGAASSIMSKVGEHLTRGKNQAFDQQTKIINELGNSTNQEKSEEVVQAETETPKQVMFLPNTDTNTYQSKYSNVNFGDRTVAIGYKGGVVVGTKGGMQEVLNLYQKNQAVEDASTLSTEEKTAANRALRDAIIRALEGEDLTDVVQDSTDVIVVKNAAGLVIATKEVTQATLKEEMVKLGLKYPGAEITVQSKNLEEFSIDYSDDPEIDAVGDLDPTETPDGEREGVVTAGLDPMRILAMAEEEAGPDASSEEVQTIFERIMEESGGGAFGQELEEARIAGAPEVVALTQTERKALEQLEKEGTLTEAQKARLTKLRKGDTKKKGDTLGEVQRFDPRKYKKTNYEPKPDEKTDVKSKTEDLELIELREAFLDYLTEQEKTEFWGNDINSGPMRTLSRSMLREFFRQLEASPDDPQSVKDLAKGNKRDLRIATIPDDPDSYGFVTFQSQTLEGKTLNLVENAIIEGFAVDVYMPEKYIDENRTQATPQFKIRVTNPEANATIGYGSKEINFADSDVSVNMHTLIYEGYKLFPELQEALNDQKEQLLKTGTLKDPSLAYTMGLISIIPDLFANLQQYGFEVVVQTDPLNPDSEYVNFNEGDFSAIPMLKRVDVINSGRPTRRMSLNELIDQTLYRDRIRRETMAEPDAKELERRAKEREFRKYMDILTEIKVEQELAQGAGFAVDLVPAFVLARQIYVEQGGDPTLFISKKQGLGSLTTLLDNLADAEAELQIAQDRIDVINQQLDEMEEAAAEFGRSDVMNSQIKTLKLELFGAKDEKGLISKRNSLINRVEFLDKQYDRAIGDYQQDITEIDEIQKPMEDSARASGDMDIEGGPGEFDVDETGRPVRTLPPTRSNIEDRGDVATESRRLNQIDARKTETEIREDAEKASIGRAERRRREKEESLQKQRNQHIKLLERQARLEQKGLKLDPVSQRKLDELNAKTPLRKIISGGQTGADQFFLNLAAFLGIRTGGLAPQGYKVEGNRSMKQRLKERFDLSEDSSPDYLSRTKKNVENSDGTLILVAEGEITPGSQKTIEFAEQAGKPYLLVTENTTANEIQQFIAKNNIKVLNGAGSRGSTFAKKFNIQGEENQGRIVDESATTDSKTIRRMFQEYPNLREGLELGTIPRVPGAVPQGDPTFRGSALFNPADTLNPDGLDMELGDIKVTAKIAAAFDLDLSISKDSQTWGETLIGMLQNKLKNNFKIPTKIFIFDINDEINLDLNHPNMSKRLQDMLREKQQKMLGNEVNTGTNLSIPYRDGPLKGLPQFSFILLRTEGARYQGSKEARTIEVANTLGHELGHTIFKYELTRLGLHRFFPEAGTRRGDVPNKSFERFRDYKKFPKTYEEARPGNQDPVYQPTEAELKMGQTLYEAFLDDLPNEQDVKVALDNEIRAQAGETVTTKYDYRLRDFPFEEWYADKMAMFLLEQEGPISDIKDQTPRKEGPVNVWAGNNENTILSNIQVRSFRFNVNKIIEQANKEEIARLEQLKKDKSLTRAQHLEINYQLEKLKRGYDTKGFKGESIGPKFQSVEHAYQTLKSGKFDEKVYRDPRWGKSNIKIKGNFKPNQFVKDKNFNIKLMKDLMRESFEQSPAARLALLNTGNRKITHTQDNTIWKEQFPKTLMELRSEFSAKKFKAGKKVETYFQKLTKKIRELYNTIKDWQRGRYDSNPVFDDYAKGVVAASKSGLDRTSFPYSATESIEMNDWVTETSDIVQRAVGEQNANRFQALIKKILSSEAVGDIRKFLTYVLAPADNFLRLVAPELGRALYSRSQTQEETGFFNYHPIVQYRYINDFYKIFDIVKDPTTQDLENIDNILEGAEKLAALPLDERAAAADNLVVEDANGNSIKVDGAKSLATLKFFDDFYEKYLLPNERDKKNPKVLKNMNFFTRQFDIAKLADDPGARTALVNILEKYNPKVTREEIISAVDKMVLFNESIDGVLAEGAADLSIGMQKDRQKLFINVIDNSEFRNIEGVGDLIVPAHHAVRKYISENVKKVEFRRKVKTTITAKDIANSDNRLAKRDEGRIIRGPRAAEIMINRIQGQKDKGRARKALQAMLGKAGMDMPGWLRTMQSYLLALNVMTYLTFATVASLVDLAGPVLRSKEMSIFSGNFIKSVKDTWTNRAELEQFARDVGVVGFDSISQMYINAGELGYMTEGTKYYTQQFFKWTGLEWYTKFTRVFAAGMGRQFLLKHANDTSAKSKEYLAELQVTPEQIKAAQDSDWDFTDPQHRAVQDAIARFTEESIVRPNAAERPGWASNPYTALIFQLKSFFYAYGKNIIGGVIRNTKSAYNREGKITAAALPAVLAATALLPLAMVGMELRELLKYMLSPISNTIDLNSKTPALAFDSNKFRNNSMNWPEYLLEASDRSGAFGAWTMLFPMFEAGRFGDEFYTSLLGPTAQRLEDLIKGDAQFKDYQPFAGAW